MTCMGTMLWVKESTYYGTPHDPHSIVHGVGYTCEQVHEPTQSVYVHMYLK